ncbi:MAG: MFS transporter [Bacillota bacterium]|nr:MFS transporter [Bacillota bacterium]
MNSNHLSYKHLIMLASCCILTGTSIGITGNCLGQFVTPLSQSLKQPVGSITIFITLMSISSAFFGPIVTKLMQKIHVRIIMSLGVIINCSCLCLLAFVKNIILLYGIGIILGMANICFSLIPITILLNNWFYKNVGSFTGLCASFSGLMGAIFNPIIAGMIVSKGYQYALFVSAILVLIFSLPCSLLFVRYRPQEVGVMPYGFEEFQQNAPSMKKGKSIALPFYMLIFISLIAISINFIAGLNPSIAAMANSIPLAAGLSATMVSAAMIGNVCSKLSLGVLVDKFGTKVGISIMLSFTFCGLILLSILNSKSYVLALFGCLIYGCIFACGANGPAFIMREVYGPERFAELYPTVALFGSLSYAISTAIVGKSYDLLGSYKYIILILACLCIVTIGLLFFVQFLNKNIRKKIAQN